MFFLFSHQVWIGSIIKSLIKNHKKIPIKHKKRTPAIISPNISEAVQTKTDLLPHPANKIIINRIDSNFFKSGYSLAETATDKLLEYAGVKGKNLLT